MIENKHKIIEHLKRFSDLIYKRYSIINDCNEKESLGSCCVIKTGKLNADAADTNGAYPFFTCGQEVLKIDNYAFVGKSIIIAGNGEISCKYYDGKFNAYQRTYVLQPTRYFYLFLKECELSIQDLKNNSQGSVIKFITKDMLESIHINLNKNSNLVNSKLRSIYDYISELKTEISSLKIIKSVLLAKYF